MSAILQFLLNVLDDLSIETVEWADATEVEVVFSNNLEALARNATPASHVLQKRNDLLVSFRATERKNEEGVEVLGILLCVSHALNHTNQKLEIREGARHRE